MTKKKIQAEVQTPSRPPIVVVLGHVDHGKTTLLDTIRKTNVAAREHGGITQHIGAYQIHNITFIDTPGHEAFAKMRSRGAKVADIALLVVAADDSVMPQTKESIEQIKASGASIIVVINKIDLPTAMPDKVKSDLAKNGVQVEGFGGDIPVAMVSAKTGKGVPELLELITLVAQMKGLDFAPEAPLEAVVIETRLDKGKGMVATVIVKKGTLKFGTLLFEGAKQVARVRAMFDEYGKGVAAAGPARPVEVLGFTSLPSVGSMLRTDVYLEQKSQEAVVQNAPFTAENLPDWLKPVAQQEGRKLTVILKVDTAGSMEAIIAALPKQVDLVTAAIGDISEADILTAKSAKAIIVGFNVKCPPVVEKLATAEKVVFRVYTIIYELLDELIEVVSGLKEVLAIERELGVGTVIAEFPFEKSRIAGTRVVSGRLARGDTVKIMRAEAEVARARIKSMRKGKEDVTKVEKIGVECGILFDKKVDFALQDAIIAVTT
jgi:translation initiation factor IF-2